MTFPLSLRAPRTILRVEPLDARVAPVVGAFEVASIVPTSNVAFQGVVQYGTSPNPEGAFCTGALLQDGRHILTAAHCLDSNGDRVADAANYFVRFDLPTGPITIAVPRANIFIHPNWRGNSQIGAGSDVAIMRLPVLAPNGNGPNGLGYSLYTNTNEVGRLGTLVGYGYTGTGTTGEASDNFGNDAEIQRFRIDGSGGSITVGFNGETRTLTSYTVTGLRNVLESFSNVFRVDVSRVNSSGNPNNGAFEVVFSFTNLSAFGGPNLPQVTLTPNSGFSGTVSFTTLANGSTTATKRTAVNTISGTFPGGILEANFTSQAGVGVLGSGDSGGPLFIDGLIAGIGSFGAVNSTFGTFTAWARVSNFFSSFISPIINTTPFTLIVDLSVQLGTSDGITDQVVINRFGGTTQITLNGLVIFSGATASILNIDVRAGSDPFVLNEQSNPIPVPPGGGGAPIGNQPPATSLRVFGAGPGAGPHVRAFDATTGQERFSFFAYPEAVTSGVVVAVGDVNGDGIPDIITAPGIGFSPHIKVFDGATGALIRSFFAFPEAVTTGLFLAAGDVTGNGLADIAVAAGPGGGPHVVVFRGTDLAVLASFFTYNPLVNTGIYVSLADVDGDGRADITTGAGEGFSPHVRVVRVEDQAELASFFAFDPNLVSGARVGPAMQIGGGQRGITVTTGPGSPPVAATFRLPDLVDIGRTLVFNPSFLGGVFVG